jgi:hypothetical protein
MTECLQRLEARTAPEPTFYWLTPLPPGFYSRTKGNRFRLRPRRPVGTVQSARLLFGRLRETPTGCRVSVRVRLPLYGQAFLTVWFGAIGLVTALVAWGAAHCALRGCPDADVNPLLALLFCLGLLGGGVLLWFGMRVGTSDLLAFVRDTLETS